MKKQKKEFNWKEGAHLLPEDYQPVQEVRGVGFTKLADGIYADPVLRKDDRKRKLLRAVRPPKNGFFVEESESGLKEGITPSEAARVIRKGSEKFKGLLRFKNPTPLDKSPKK